MKTLGWLFAIVVIVIVVKEMRHDSYMTTPVTLSVRESLFGGYVLKVRNMTGRSLMVSVAVGEFETAPKAVGPHDSADFGWMQGYPWKDYNPETDEVSVHADGYFPAVFRVAQPKAKQPKAEPAPTES